MSSKHKIDEDKTHNEDSIGISLLDSGTVSPQTPHSMMATRHVNEENQSAMDYKDRNDVFNTSG